MKMVHLVSLVVLLLVDICIAQPNILTRQCDLPKFQACQCGYKGADIEKIECINVDFIDASIIQEIPFEGLVDTLTNVTFTGSNFMELPPNVIGDCSHGSGKTLAHSYLGLDYLDLSDNNIGLIHGKTFHCIQNLRTLLLNDNNLDHPENSPRMFSDFEELEVLHLRNAFNFDKEGSSDGTLITLSRIFQDSGLDSLQELHLEQNYIGNIHEELFRRLPDLERLYLSHNALRNPVLSPDCHSNSPDGEIHCRLKEVYLNSNSISVLSQEFMDGIDAMKFQVTLDMSDNPFWCDCNLIETVKWLKGRKHLLKDTHRTLCRGPPMLDGTPLLNLNESDLQKCSSEIGFFGKNESSGTSAGKIVLILLFVAIGLAVVGVLVAKRGVFKKKTLSLKSTLMPRFFSRASGYDTVTNPSSTV